MMDSKKVKVLLEQYGISSIEELEYYLDIDTKHNECADDPADNKKNCMNSKCFEGFSVPDCRKIVEIYNKYFKDDFSKKKDFVQHLSDCTDKKESSLENYMSCKSCSQQMEKSIYTSLKIGDAGFKKDFCNNLNKKFNYRTLFETEYESVRQFLMKEHEVTESNFTPLYAEEENNMTEDEKEKLYVLVHVTKEELRKTLSRVDSMDVSPSFKMNLALSAFDRNLTDESLQILTNLEQLEEFSHSHALWQLKAKLLSIKKQDKEAIALLKKLIESQKPHIDSETQTLLAASIKRDAFEAYEKYGDETKLKEGLEWAKDIYYSVYMLSREYYPALNYMYLMSMLAYIDNRKPAYFQNLKDEFEVLWQELDYKVNDWWSYISSVEYLILCGKYEKAKETLEEHFNDNDAFEINEFNIISTIRQLELFSKFCTDKSLQDIISYLYALEKK